MHSRVDIASLVVFRILFGALMVIEIGRYLSLRWIESYLLEPSLRLAYYGFAWLPTLPGPLYYALFVALGVAGLGIALGWRYRLSCAAFWSGFSYVFLLEQARYLNHLYLVCLLAFLMIFVPAHRAISLDARRLGASRTAPRWSLALLRFQIGVVYVYAGLAKLNPDWVRGQPLRLWLPRRQDAWFGGEWLTWPETALAFSWAGLALDLLIVPALLWRRTRAAAFAAATTFHLMNALLWDIGIFPWAMIAATTLFLDPSWPRALWSRFVRPAAPSPPSRPPPPGAGLRPWGYAALLAWASVQLLFPLRHLLYPGDPSWTEEGHKFSWHMKLRDKRARLEVFAVDPATGARARIALRRHLTPRQIEKVLGRPELILQVAHHLRREVRTLGDAPAEIYVDHQVSLNGRRPQRLIDPTVDLGAQPWTIAPAPWLLPLEVPPVDPDEPSSVGAEGFDEVLGG